MRIRLAATSLFVLVLGTIAAAETTDPPSSNNVGRSPRPLAVSFTWSPTSPAAGQTVQFTDQSSPAPPYYDWSFGDGTPGSTLRNPTHVYAAAGTYNVMLSGGPLGSANHNIVVTAAAPVVVSFTWSPASPVAGQTVHFTDSSTGSPTSWSWTFGDGTSSSTRNPSHVYAAAGNFTVTLRAGNASGSNSTSRTIAIGATCPGAFNLTAPANRTLIDGATTAVTLAWSGSSGATSYDVHFGTAPAPPYYTNTTSTQVSVPVQPATTYYWTIAARNACGTTKSANGPQSFAILASSKPDLTAAIADVSPKTVVAGESISIGWSVTNHGSATAPASSLRLWLSPDVRVDAQADALLSTQAAPPLGAGVGASSTAAAVVPATLANGSWYVLAEADSGGLVEESSESNNVGYNSLTIAPARLPAAVVVASWPSGLVQRAGEATAVDSYTLTNSGQTSTTISLSQTGGFFQQTPSSFSLAPGQSRVVAIHATTQPAGLYDGSSIPAGDGVPPTLKIPIRLLVVTPPPERPVVVPLSTRVEVIAPAAENPAGAVTFKNVGTTAFVGMAISDVPWLIPTKDVISIAPGEQKDVRFAIDRSNRPDAASLIGGVAGLLSLRTLGPSGNQKTANLDATSGSSVSVTVVDVVKSKTSAASPPPLASGEIALFFPALGSGDDITDLHLTSHVTRATPLGLALYFKSGGSTQSLTALLDSNSVVVFPSIVRTTFGAASGSLQVRGAASGEISVSAQQIVGTPAAPRTLHLPLLRSDAGVPPGEQLVLAGIAEESTVTSRIYIQEVSGNAASIAVDFTDAAGRSLSAIPPSVLAPFGSLELIGVVPRGAIAARITNGSGAAGRIAAYATVSDSATGDAFVVVDMTRAAHPPDATHVIPLVSSKTSTTSLVLTNKTAAATDVAVETIAASSSRHRAAGQSFGIPINAETFGSTVLQLAPYETIATELQGSGYAKVTTTAGAVAISGRMRATDPSGSTTSALASAPAASSLSYGQRKTFLGVYDSAGHAAATAGTFTSRLIAVETAGASATIRVTLRFTFPAGGKVSASSTASRDFTIAPRRMLSIDNLGRTIIGSERDNYADFRNVRVDVEVVSGSGRVSAFMQSVDRGTGEVVLRSE